ncbi:hypothetical protein SAMN05216464_1287 [Mucilaginibacter pineti]|uniref:Uncharacterized protein n=1 Tax=Mucilaginibacter pineti TaxID=1391627 RepID=A0A1G7NKV9_9SPHI|nr:hypothetical protein [Mucilaginibacter pineti]SDF74755.1 hypothetical protein SAMN05216464_1287 [Mucilaginibacter pineti]
MKPIQMTIGDRSPLMIIPDSEAHVDGHPVLTYTYSVYQLELPAADAGRVNIEKLSGPQRKEEPRYLGYITFEQPGKLFTYTADGHDDLSGAEVEEIIEKLNEYRDSPQMWQIEY